MTEPALIELTAKQKLFCAEFVVDLNGAAAYRRAGYAARAAKVGAHKLLQNPAVKAEIGRLLAARLERLELTADEVIGEIRAVLAEAKTAKSPIGWAPYRMQAIQLMAKIVGLTDERLNLDLTTKGQALQPHVWEVAGMLINMTAAEGAQFLYPGRDGVVDAELAAHAPKQLEGIATAVEHARKQLKGKDE